MKSKSLERTEQCYMCNKPSTSKEHVPPKCIFPEAKDLGSEKFRENLIKVPSCDLHNMKKSKDDEYLMIVLAIIIGNNLYSLIQASTKVKRAIERRKNDFLDKEILKNTRVEIRKINLFRG